MLCLLVFFHILKFVQNYSSKELPWDCCGSMRQLLEHSQGCIAQWWWNSSWGIKAIKGWKTFMHLSFKLNSLLVLFLCIASQDVISNVESKINRYYFPFCFLCPIPLLYLSLNSSWSFWQKNTGATKVTRFLQCELWHRGWPKVLDMVQRKFLESHKSILHWLLLSLNMNHG